MKSPLKHCNAPVLHNPETNKMRSNIASTSGRGTGNEVALKQATNKRKGTLMKKRKSTCGSPMTMVLRSKGPKVKNSSNTECWDGYKKVGTKPSPSGTGETVNDCVKI